MNPWLIAALVGGALLAAARVAGAATLRLPPRALPFLPILRREGRRHGIPVAVLAAWVKRESDWNPNAYNPEGGEAMRRWACEVASHPDRWRGNPDYEHAVRVCDHLQAGGSASDVVHLWTFGSAGLMQVSSISARERGGLAYDADNRELLDPAINVAVGARVIAALRTRVFPGRRALLDHEWATVRAAYVGGFGILAQRPERAREIAQAFLVTLRAIA